MKICVCGNSHIAAFKEGWDLAKDEYPGVEVNFFGAHVTQWLKIEAIGGKLVATDPALKTMLEYTSGGLSEIAGHFDRYLIAGSQFSAQMFLRAYADLSGEFNPDVFVLSAKALLVDGHAFKMAALLKSITASPIVLAPSPYQTKGDGTLPVDYYSTTTVEERTKLEPIYLRLARELADQAGCGLLLQPRQTIAGPMITKRRFGHAAPQFLKKASHSQVDVTHMNAEFGALCWGKILTDSKFIGDRALAAA